MAGAFSSAFSNAFDTASGAPYTLTAESGSYVITGTAATLHPSATVMEAASGAYTITGSAATLSEGGSPTPSRFYFSKVAPNVVLHAPLQGSWDGGFLSEPRSPVNWSWRLVSTKAAAGTKFTGNLHTNQQGDFDSHFAEWRTYPLEAQTVDGTVDLCVFSLAQWADDTGNFPLSSVRFKLHVYIAVGDSRTVRHTLLNNYIDGTDLESGVATWQSLASAQTLTSGAASAGDVVVVELGVRVISSPTPTPTYPPTASTLIVFRPLGTNSATADATAGSTDSSLNAWIEFSHQFAFQSLPAPPANDACADAIAIPSFPYQSAGIDCSQAAGTQRETFWSFTAPTTGRMVLHNFGSNFATDIDLFKDCALAAPDGSGVTGDNTLATHRSQTCLVFDVTAASTYIARVRNTAQTFNATNGGGVVKLGAFYVDTPEVDDLYLPAGVIGAFREGVMVNVNPDFTDNQPTGIAIDYTGRAMDDLNGGTHSNVRLLIGLHAFDLVEILDIVTLNAGEGEIDFIGDTWDLSIPGPAQLYVTEDGTLYSGWFGNGYLYVLGVGVDRPAVLNTVSSDTTFSAIKIIDATKGDNQPGGPFAASILPVALDITAPWALTFDESAEILYYTSGGVYVPVGGQRIKRYSTGGSVQLGDFVTVPSGGGFNPGVKGLTILPDRSVLVCNATEVVHYDSGGNELATFTPSVPLDSLSLTDVKVTADGESFWVVDLWTASLFKFSLVTGLEEGYYPTYLKPGTLVQMALYNPEPLPPVEPPPPPVAPACPPIPDPSPAAAGCVRVVPVTFH